MIPDLEIPVPEIFIHPEIRENLYVPGSPKATVSLVGWYRLCSENTFIIVVIIPARNAVAEGSIFTGVCQSFCPGGMGTGVCQSFCPGGMGTGVCQSFCPGGMGTGVCQSFCPGWGYITCIMG